MEKSLAKNSLYNILYKLISTLYPLVSVTYVSHILRADRVGQVSYAQNIVSYFVVIAALGIPTYGIREIAIRSGEKEKTSQTFWELFVINFTATTVALMAYALLVINVSKFSSNILLYTVAGLQIVFNYANVDWFYQGMEEYKYISFRNIIVKLVALVSLPILIKNPDDYIKYALVYCLAIGGNNLINIIHLRSYIISPQNKLNCKKHLKPVAMLLMVSIAVEVYAMIDTSMLGIFCDDVTVGCYSNAMKLTRMVITTISAIGAVLFPRLSKIYSEGNNKRFNELVNSGIKIMLYFAIPALVGIVLLRTPIIYVFFGDSFIDAIDILRILSIMIPIVVCNSIMGGQVLVTTNREKQYIISVVTASVINVFLNAIFIPRFGAPSAAIASLISETVVLGSYIYFSKDLIQIRIPVKYIASIVIPLIIYVFISRVIIQPHVISNISALIINISICMIIYFSGTILLKNEAALMMLAKAKKILGGRKNG